MSTRSILLVLSMVFICAVSTSATAQVVVTAEDFEDGNVFGWSRGGAVSDESSNPVFTRFLGRFFGPNDFTRTTNKTFDLPGDQTEVVIEFDFYEIDSWDFNETFRLFIDDDPVPVIEDRFFEARFDNPELATPLQSGPFVNDHGFNASWPDQTYTYSLLYPTTADTLKLDFHFLLDSGPGDESAGIDNVFITTTPEPTTAGLLALPLLATVFKRRRSAG